MNKYRRVQKEKESLPENEIRVKQGPAIGRYLRRANDLFNSKEQSNDKVIIKGVSAAVESATKLAELVKHRIKNLHQITELQNVEMVDEYEPLEEGLDKLQFKRNATMIVITLSKTPLDKTHVGYQEPIPLSEVQEYDEREFGESRPRRAGFRGGLRGGPRGGRGGRGRGHSRERDDYEDRPPRRYDRDDYDERPPRPRGGRGRGGHGGERRDRPPRDFDREERDYDRPPPRRHYEDDDRERRGPPRERGTRREYDREDRPPRRHYDDDEYDSRPRGRGRGAPRGSGGPRPAGRGRARDY